VTKSILIVHDIGYSNVDKMMRDIDYVAQSSKAFTGDFTIYVEPSSALVPIMEESGLPFSKEDLPEEPDYIISFIYDLYDNSKASTIAMNQWKSRRPVFPFMVIKNENEIKD